MGEYNGAQSRHSMRKIIIIVSVLILIIVAAWLLVIKGIFDSQLHKELSAPPDDSQLHAWIQDAIEQAETKRDEGLCDQIPAGRPVANGDEIVPSDDYIRECISRVALMAGDPRLCSRLPDGESARLMSWNRTRCLADVMGTQSGSNAASGCQASDDQRANDECLKNAGVRNMDASLCALIHDLSLRSECTWKNALDSADLPTCSLIVQNGDPREFSEYYRCIDAVINFKYQSMNVDACNTIAGLRSASGEDRAAAQRNYCTYSLAQLKKDTRACDMILENEQLQEKCLRMEGPIVPEYYDN